jgi:hypothetical protein
MQNHMQDIVDDMWSMPTVSHAKPAARTAVKLVTDAAHFIAQQHDLKQGTLTYGALLAETYRAGGFACTSHAHLKLSGGCMCCLKPMVACRYMSGFSNRMTAPCPASPCNLQPRYDSVVLRQCVVTSLAMVHEHT